MKDQLFIGLIALLFVHACTAVEKDHEMCCHSCVTKYGAATATNIETTSCLRGCRLYGMIFLAHDPSVARSEIASLCTKSCKGTAACAAGCASQERVFRERQVDGHAARLAVMFGLAAPPEVRSPAPYHARMFRRMWPHHAQQLHTQLHQQQQHPNVWLHAVSIRVRPLGPGPDGRPRFWVQISEHAVPLRQVASSAFASEQLIRRTHTRPFPFHAHFAGHLSHRARLLLRWAACSLVALSLLGLLCLACSMLTRRRSGRRSSERDVIPVTKLTAAFGKLPPTSIQSGDIIYVPDKQPLLAAEQPMATVDEAKDEKQAAESA